jgi:hypothetical protein
MTTDLLANLKKRRADWNDRLSENRKALADAMQAVLVDEAHLQEIDFAIEALSIVPHGAPAAPPEKPPEKAPLDKCIAAIRSTFIMPLREGVTDRMAQEQLAKAGHKFRLPVVRKALAMIGQEARAVQPAPDAHAEASHATPRDGAGTAMFDIPQAETVDQVEADRPAFTRRTKQEAAE